MSAGRATPDAAELVELLGMATAYELLKRHVGTNYLYVPLKPSVKHRLTLVVGFVAAQKLSDKWGGHLLKLPTDRSLVVDARNAKITRLVESGENYSAVGRLFGLTRQQVKNISVGDTAGKRNK